MGGTLGLLGQFVASGLNGRREKRAAQRLATREALATAYNVRAAASYRRLQSDDVQGDEVFDEKVSELRLKLAAIRDPRIRDRFVSIVRCLEYTSAIRQFCEVSQIASARNLAEHSAQLLEAHLHDVKLPKPPEFLTGYLEAIQIADDIQDEIHDDINRQRDKKTD